LYKPEVFVQYVSGETRWAGLALGIYFLTLVAQVGIVLGRRLPCGCSLPVYLITYIIYMVMRKWRDNNCVRIAIVVG
jgi:hypothetical protein